MLLLLSVAAAAFFMISVYEGDECQSQIQKTRYISHLQAQLSSYIDRQTDKRGGEVYRQTDKQTLIICIIVIIRFHVTFCAEAAREQKWSLLGRLIQSLL